MNQLPAAAFSSSCEALTCNFTDASTDADGSLTNWSWDFGDGDHSTERHPSHTYGSADTYSVTLTVRDNDDATKDVTHSVTVTAPPPTNELPATAFSAGCDALECSFTDESTDADWSVASWSWDFGDGSPQSTANNPPHSYGGRVTMTSHSSLLMIRTQRQRLHIPLL